MAERFQKVTTSQEHQTITNAVLYWTQIRQPSSLLRIVMVSSKLTFLFMNWQITVQQKRLIYFSLDFWIVPYSSKGSEIANSKCIFLDWFSHR